jgi:hypothetical protein
MRELPKDLVDMAKRHRRLRWRGQIKSTIHDQASHTLTEVVLEIVPTIGEKLTIVGWPEGTMRQVTDVRHIIGEDYHSVLIVVGDVDKRA